MTDHKFQTPRTTTSFSSHQEFSSLSPAVKVGKRYSLSPTAYKDLKNSNDLSKYGPATSVTSANSGLRGSLKYSVLDMDMTNIEERIAKMNYNNDAKYEIRIGEQTVDFDTQDKIFKLTEPIDPSKNFGDSCVMCQKEISASKRQHC
jgi:hypothetical protein